MFGMIECRRCLGFAFEAAERLRVASDRIGKEFQRDEAAEFDVFSFIDDAHAATTDLFDDAVMREGTSNQTLRILHFAPS